MNFQWVSSRFIDPCNACIFSFEDFPFADCLCTSTKLMLACGIPDFSLKDIFTPTRERLLKMFSGIINFAKYREEKISVFKSYLENTVRVDDSFSSQSLRL